MYIQLCHIVQCRGFLKVFYNTVYVPEGEVCTVEGLSILKLQHE